MQIRIALAGNPNSGKTTLFNALTGSNQFVGNWPGVTVEKKEGKLKRYEDVTLTDLPGIYSLSPYSPEEVVARNYLMNSAPDAILNMIDGTNLERNLYLTTQLAELGIPMIVAVNMMDALEKSGDKLHSEILAKELGCPVVELSALKGIGINEAADAAVKAAQNATAMSPKHKFAGSVEHALAHIEEAIQGLVPEERQRWTAIKLFERDEMVRKTFSAQPQILDHIEQDIRTCEQENDDDAESIITDERYRYITSIIDTCCERKNKQQFSTSDRIDRIVTNRWFALPIFAAVMFLIYYISVSTVGAWLTDWTNDVLFGGIITPAAAGFFEAIHTAPWLSGLIVDGIIGGVGAVLGFVPQMLLLFAFLAFLESCGYMARVAFILDRIFRRFGLSGKSFIPMLIGSGCGVPGIMASRTIENDRDRRMTIITTTFIPCGAKLPIIALIAGALFGGAWWVAPSAYFIGIAAILCSGIILKKTRLFSSEATPFVMELPAYRMPTAVNVLRSMWERGWSFIRKAGTIILLAVILVWFTSNFGIVDGRFGMVENLNDGLLSAVGGFLAPIFAPLGWGDWRATVSALTGLIAKENVVGTLGVLYGFAEVAEDGAELWGTLAASFTALSAYSFLIFNLLCAPCFAAMGAIRREMNSAKWTWFAIGYQTIFAYVVSLCIYQFGILAQGAPFTAASAAAFAAAFLFLYLLLRPASKEKQLRPATDCI
ncbi:MAG: ferrous iron transport protein B [Anaerofustis sp.]